MWRGPSCGCCRAMMGQNVPEILYLFPLSPLTPMGFLLFLSAPPKTCLLAAANSQRTARLRVDFSQAEASRLRRPSSGSPPPLHSLPVSPPPPSLSWHSFGGAPRSVHCWGSPAVPNATSAPYHGYKSHPRNIHHSATSWCGRGQLRRYFTPRGRTPKSPRWRRKSRGYPTLPRLRLWDLGESRLRGAVRHSRPVLRGTHLNTSLLDWESNIVNSIACFAWHRQNKNSALFGQKRPQKLLLHK